MLEFGEKVKQVREERGMTQQSLAEKLYVTRQAVSRWECGARYPDLLTAKKISAILEVSLDELLSGEELIYKMEKEPVLAQPIENIVQTALYAIASIVYFLLCTFSFYSYLRPNEALSGTPAGEISFIVISSDVIRIVSFAAVALGLILSAKNKLTAKLTGYVMCIPYVLSALSFLVTYIDMQIKKNGHINLWGWLADFIVPLVFAMCIILFFKLRERRIAIQIILGICILTICKIAYCYKGMFLRFTELGFVVTTVHMVGKTGMAVLLGYQAYVLDKKKRIACEI